MAKNKVGLNVELAVIDKLTKPLRDVTKRINAMTAPLARVNRQMTAVSRASGFSKMSRNAGVAFAIIGKVSTALGGVLRQMRNITFVGAAGIFGTGFIIKNVADAGLEFERFETKFDNAFKGGAGLKLLDTLREMGKVLPLTAEQFVSMADTVRGLGGDLKPDQILEMVTTLGDVAALTGANTKELAVSIGQSTSKAAIDTRDIKELEQRGISIRKFLAEQFNKDAKDPKFPKLLAAIKARLGKDKVSAGDIQKLVEDRQISGEMMRRTFIGLNKEGGKFFRGMEIFGKTIGGQITRVSGKFQDLKIQLFGTSEKAGLLGPVLDSIFKRLEPILDSISKLIERNSGRMEKWAKQFDKMLPSVRELKDMLRGLWKEAVTLWDRMKPLLSIIVTTTKKVGVLNSVVITMTFLIGIPLVTALINATLAMKAFLFSAGAMLVRIPALTAVIKGGLVLALKTVVAWFSLYTPVILAAVAPIAILAAKIVALVLVIWLLIKAGIRLADNWERVKQKWESMSPAAKFLVSMLLLLFAPLTMILTAIMKLVQAFRVVAFWVSNVGEIYGAFLDKLSENVVINTIVQAWQFWGREIDKIIGRFSKIGKIMGGIKSLFKGGSKTLNELGDLFNSALGTPDEDFSTRTTNKVEAARENKARQQRVKIEIDAKNLPKGMSVTAVDERGNVLDSSSGLMVAQ